MVFPPRRLDDPRVVFHDSELTCQALEVGKLEALTLLAKWPLQLPLPLLSFSRRPDPVRTEDQRNIHSQKDHADPREVAVRDRDRLGPGKPGVPGWESRTIAFFNSPLLVSNHLH